MVTQETNTALLNLTPAAAHAVQDLIIDKKLEGYGLRVFVSGGGCGGYQYGMALDDNTQPNDTISEQHGVKLLIDDISLQYLSGATIDYQDNEAGTGFKIDNPNSVSSCGCGGDAGGCGGDSGGCSCGC